MLKRCLKNISVKNVGPFQLPGIGLKKSVKPWLGVIVEYNELVVYQTTYCRRRTIVHNSFCMDYYIIIFGRKTSKFNMLNVSYLIASSGRKSKVN